MATLTTVILILLASAFSFCIGCMIGYNAGHSSFMRLSDALREPTSDGRAALEKNVDK